MAYAIVKTGGKQYSVKQGDTLLVEKLVAEEGDTVSLETLLVAGDKAPVFDAKGLENAAVSAKVLGHEKGPKIRVFKYKPKRGYKKTMGHRQQLTKLEITEITHGA